MWSIYVDDMKGDDKNFNFIEEVILISHLGLWFTTVILLLNGVYGILSNKKKSGKIDGVLLVLLSLLDFLELLNKI